jgi:alkylation response protein AidB-like acyl-CoA dehydrogenase
VALGTGDLSTARLAEGHADAVAILADAGRSCRPDHMYGVWASVADSGDVTADTVGWVLSGTKPFCSGAGACDRALVRAGDLLVDVGLRQPGVHPLDGTWPAVGMSGSDSRAVRFERVPFGPDDVVGTTAWYLERPGFRHGGIGVAAVWTGGARGALDATVAALGGDAGDAELAALGSAAAAVASADGLLAAAAAAIDADPDDRAGDARRLAAVTRHGVHAAAVETLRATAAAGGARALSLDGANARRAADLWAYLAQHHPGRDAATLGRLLVQGAAR